MSRKQFFFMLSELKTVRFICKKCGAVAEMNIGQIDMSFGNPSCKACSTAYDGASTSFINTLTKLGKTLEAAQADSLGCEIEFVLPDNN